MWSADPVVASSSQCEDGNASHDDIDRMLLEGFGMYDTRTLGGDDGLKDELDIDAETYYLYEWISIESILLLFYPYEWILC